MGASMLLRPQGYGRAARFMCFPSKGRSPETVELQPSGQLNLSTTKFSLGEKDYNPIYENNLFNEKIPNKANPTQQSEFKKFCRLPV
jgi:hypothetical protein